MSSPARAPSGIAVLTRAHEPVGTPAGLIGATDHGSCLNAATAAGAHNFIAELPEDYRTPIGRDGIAVSPAQALRLTIAHLLAHSPRVLVVDDPTEGLDEAGEAAALPGLEILFRGREVTIVAASPAVRAVAKASRAGLRGSGPPTPALARLPADPGLPQLAQLLDPRRMAPVLGHNVSLGVPDVRVQSVRYKPGDNVVVQYAVTTGRGWSTAVAYAAAGGDLTSKPHRRRNRLVARRSARKSPVLEPVSYLPEVSALVHWLPADVRMPLLSLGPKKLNRRLAEAGLAPVENAKPKVLRYWARRRAAVSFGPYVLKTYRDPLDYREAEQGLVAAAHLRNVRTPAFEAALPRRRTTVQRLVTGFSPSLRPAASEPAGVLLAELHAESVPNLRATTPADVLQKSAVRAELVGHLLPELRTPLEDLLSRLEATLPPGGPPVTSHGNYHAGQLLEDGHGLVLIDLDRLCLSDPAYDLASFAAHVAFGHPGEMDTVTAVVDSLVRGYGSRPDGLEWFLSNCLLRRAPVPFRHQDEHWPAAITTIFACAREALS
jgi:Phosphotransferase enzyme family